MMEEKSPTKINKTINRLLDRLFGTYGIILGLFLIGAGIFYSYLINSLTPWDGNTEIVKLTATFLKECGLAVIILIGIAFTLDRRHRESFLQEVRTQIDAFKKDSFASLYGWTIPKKILYEVESQIFKNVLIRDKCCIEYLLREIPDEYKTQIDETCDIVTEKRIIVDIILKYELRNIKTTPITHQIKCFLEKEDAPQFNRVIKVITISDNLPSTYEEEDVKRFLDTSDEINNIYAFNEIELPPEKSISVEIHYRMIRAYNHTREVYFSILPSMGLEIDVKCNVPNLLILAELISPHYSDLKEIPCSDKGGAYCIEKKWIVNKPLLPYQGLMLWWHKTDKGIH